jgi:hypothetical protein
MNLKYILFQTKPKVLILKLCNCIRLYSFVDMTNDFN